MMPTVLQYTAALESLSDNGLDSAKREMLRAHLASPLHSTTMSLLASHVGYPDYNSANLHYGTLGRMLAEAGGFSPPVPRFKLSAIATWGVEAPDGSGHFAFKMRPELVKALEGLGWNVGAKPPKEPVAPEDYLEGAARKTFIHVRQREGRARQAKLAEAIAESTDGRLHCEVPQCGFDFEAVYGERGRQFAEVHHKNPLAASKRNRRTQLSDLAVVCANCHAMVHRFGDTAELATLIVATRRR